MESDDNNEISTDYFKCMQHAGQRPMTHTLPYSLGLGNYMHAPLTGICRTVYDQEAFAAN
jgi:hypothetical protein